MPNMDKQYLETQFGSDEAFGLYFVDVHNRRLSLSEFEALYAELGDDMPGTESFLSDGGSGTCCTNYAAFIYKTLPGRVKIFGFANEDNPECDIVREQLHPGGHDFALVDDRFLVDPWCLLVAGQDWPVVYDSHEGEDLFTLLVRYGPPQRWTHMRAAEQFADKQLSLSA